MNSSFENQEGKEDWITPKWIVEDLNTVFDTDPCVSLTMPWNFAPTRYTVVDDGLSKEWFGKVWCNPPYGRKAQPFIAKCAKHGNAIVLIFARTDTKVWHEEIFNKADALLFMKGRVKFCNIKGVAKGTAGSPSVLVAYGEENAKILEESKIQGKFVRLK